MKRVLIMLLFFGLFWLWSHPPATAACQPVQDVGRISAVTRTIYPLPWPVRWTVGGWTVSIPPRIFLVVTRERYTIGERVLVTGCLVGDEIRNARLVHLY